MYVDTLLELSDAQALTATGNTTNTIDLGGDKDVGRGQTLYLVLSLDVAADGANADETYVFTLTTDDNTGFSSPTTIITHTINRGTAAGARWTLPLPYNNERYLRGTMTLGGTTPSITFTAHITDQEPASWAAQPDAI